MHNSVPMPSLTAPCLGSASAPDLKNTRATENRVRIAGERMEVPDRLAKLVFGYEPILQNGLGDGLESHASEELDPAFHRRGLNQSHPYAFEAGLAQQPRKLRTEVRIGPARPHGL